MVVVDEDSYCSKKKWQMVVVSEEESCYCYYYSYDIDG